MTRCLLGTLALEEETPVSSVQLPDNTDIIKNTAELDVQGRDLTQLNDNLHDATEATGQLGSIQKAMACQEAPDTTTAEMASIAIESIRLKLGMEQAKPIVALEAFGSASANSLGNKLAVDGVMGVIWSIIKAIYDVIKRFFKKLYEFLFGAKKVIEKHRDRVATYRRYADALGNASLLSTTYSGVMPGNLSGFITSFKQSHLDAKVIGEVLTRQAEVAKAAASSLSTMVSDGSRYNAAIVNYATNSLDPDKSQLKDAGELIDLIERDLKPAKECPFIQDTNHRAKDMMERGLFKGQSLFYEVSTDLQNPKYLRSIFSTSKFILEATETRSVSDMELCDKSELLQLIDILTSFVDASERLMENAEKAIKMSGALEKLTKATEMYLKKDGSYDKDSKTIALDVQAAVGMFAGWINVLGVDLVKLNVHATNAAFGYVEICLKELDKANKNSLSE